MNAPRDPVSPAARARIRERWYRIERARIEREKPCRSCGAASARGARTCRDLSTRPRATRPRKDMTMKHSLLVLTITVITACTDAAGPPPEVGRSEHEIQYNDGGTMIVDTEADMLAAYRQITKCVPPDEWWSEIQRTDGGTHDVFSTGQLVSDREANGGITSARYNCGNWFQINGDGTATICVRCCTLVRKCASTSSGGVTCWLEVQCDRPWCVTSTFTG